VTDSGFIVIDNSTDTSGAIRVMEGVARPPVPGLAEALVMHTYWKPREGREELAGYREIEPTVGATFFHHTVLTTPGTVSVIVADARSVNYGFHELGTLHTGFVQLRNLDVPALRRLWDTQTTPTWEIVAPLAPDLASALSHIESVLTGIRLAQPMVRSTSLLRLAERAADARSERPRDLENWAQALTDDVKDAND
jgi:hypothetical protein